MTKLKLTKELHDLRVAVNGKSFEEAKELFKDIESIKIKIKTLDEK